MSLSKSLIATYIVLALAFFLESCASSNQNSSRLPSWYINPQQNNSRFLYGIAQGYNLNEAKTAALYEASSRLSSTVSATTSLIREENNFSTNEQINQNIKQISAEIRFNDYKLVNSEVINNIFFVEIQIDKSEFINFYQDEINKLYQQAIDLDKKSANQNIISRYSSLKKISEIFDKVNLYRSILSSLGANSLSPDKLQNIQKLSNESQSINLKIEFSIDKSSPNDVSKVISQALNRENIKLINQANNSINNINLKLRIIENKKEVFGHFMNNLTIYIECFAKNKLIKSNKIEVTGSSASDYELARKSALRKFEERVKKQGIFEILDIN